MSTRRLAKYASFIGLLATLVIPQLVLTGCDKESDPQAKVDAPGYYNGPMKQKGGAKAPTDTDK